MYISQDQAVRRTGQDFDRYIEGNCRMGEEKGQIKPSNAPRNFTSARLYHTWPFSSTLFAHPAPSRYVQLFRRLELTAEAFLRVFGRSCLRHQHNVTAEAVASRNTKPLKDDCALMQTAQPLTHILLCDVDYRAIGSTVRAGSHLHDLVLRKEAFC